MEPEKNPSKVRQEPALPEADFSHLAGHFQQYTEQAQQRQALLIKQVEDLHERQRHWINRLGLTQQERRMLQTYWLNQQTALESAMQEHNRSMKAIGEAQVTFVREVCNSLLTLGRANLQFGRSVLYQEQSLQLHAALEEKNRAFWDLFEAKVKDAEDRPEGVRRLIYQQAERMLERWNQQFEDILDDFLALLRERV